MNKTSFKWFGDILEIYWTDVYKTGHKFMLPPGSTLMYSNFTPRSGKLANFPNSKGILSFGQQMLVRKLKEDWEKNFFSRPVEEIYQFGKDMTAMLMLDKPYDVSHFVDLHELGYLPLEIKAVPEGMFIPYKVPMLTIVNTHPINNQVFDWLVNYLETILSAESWQAPTSATLGFEFRKLGLEYAKETDPENIWFVDYQFHDFSMRGMGGKSAIVNSGLGFSICSKGSDTLPVIPMARKFYDEEGVCISSVIATEHAIMCTLTGFYLQQKDGTWEKIGELEVETFRYLLKLFPSGILSVVSDTWDLWRVIVEYCSILKEDILARNGKLVIRPDSGDPVDIVCGLNTSDSELSDIMMDHPSYKGVVELLWEVFGGSATSTGFKKLDPHIGMIYGDSITLDRAKRVFQRLKGKGFASTNVVLGVGSYSLQYVTRDTHGFAQKATYVEVNGVGIEIFKDPVTDNGTKKSARGLIKVIQNEESGDLEIIDGVSWEEERTGILQTIFKDGELFNQTTLTEIRKKVGLS